MLLALVLAAAASATPIAPYDGSNPFRCKTQKVGTGVDFQDPDADPFCVEFDKRQQNVTELGIVDFLLNEPARVAAAVPKCFYHQTDHWTGSIEQGQDPTLWHWDGRYFFDKARGMGGVRIDNLVLAGLPADPRRCPASRRATRRTSGRVAEAPTCSRPSRPIRTAPRASTRRRRRARSTSRVAVPRLGLSGGGSLFSQYRRREGKMF